MQRIFCSFLLFILVYPAFAQKTFTMADAITKRAMFVPANLRQVEWIPDTDAFTHTSGNKLIRVTASNLKNDTLDLLSGINPTLTKMDKKALTSIPGIISNMYNGTAQDTSAGMAGEHEVFIKHKQRKIREYCNSVDYTKWQQEQTQKFIRERENSQR